LHLHLRSINPVEKKIVVEVVVKFNELIFVFLHVSSEFDALLADVSQPFNAGNRIWSIAILGFDDGI